MKMWRNVTFHNSLTIQAHALSKNLLLIYSNMERKKAQIIIFKL